MKITIIDYNSLEFLKGRFDLLFEGEITFWGSGVLITPEMISTLELIYLD